MLTENIQAPLAQLASVRLASLDPREFFSTSHEACLKLLSQAAASVQRVKIELRCGSCAVESAWLTAVPLSKACVECHSLACVRAAPFFL